MMEMEIALVMCEYIKMKKRTRSRLAVIQIVKFQVIFLEKQTVM